MTLINAMVAGDGCAYLLVDSALYKASDGFVVGFGEKAHAVPRLGLAVALMGLESSSSQIVYVLEELRSFEEVEEHFPAAVQARWDDGLFGEYGVAEEHEHFRVTIAAWCSRRQRGEVRQLSSFAEGGASAFEWRETCFTLSPGIGDPAMLPDGLTMTPAGMVVSPSAMAGPAVLVQAALAQRHVSGFNPVTSAASAGLFVGGDVVLTKVAENGISQIVVHRWPDELHACIDTSKDPAPAATSAANVISISRQLRRAQARSVMKPSAA